MEASEAIMTLRSARMVENRQVPDAVLEKILRAGTCCSVRRVNIFL